MRHVCPISTFLPSGATGQKIQPTMTSFAIVSYGKADMHASMRLHCRSSDENTSVFVMAMRSASIR